MNTSSARNASQPKQLLQIFDVVVQAPEAELRIARPEHGLDRRVAQRFQGFAKRRRVRARQEAVRAADVVEVEQYCRLPLRRGARDKSLAALGGAYCEEAALHGPRTCTEGTHGCCTTVDATMNTSSADFARVAMHAVAAMACEHFA